jgi:RNA polymerase sigma-70 factor (ECF subfamily)
LENFSRRGDQEAFTDLVGRHGPMVLGVCRRVLGHVQEAEDAFQATFIVLMRRAGSIRNPELLGNWLYGVAFRVARKARAQAARRSKHERQAVPMPDAGPDLEFAWQELRALLDQELQHLPAKYRTPLILCYLEGLTHEEAARRLGWPVGSMSYRLARAREALRARLEKHRADLPGGTFALVLTQKAGPAALPGTLVQATVRAGATGVMSAPVQALVKYALLALAAAKWKNLLLVLLLILLSAASAIVAYNHWAQTYPSGHCSAGINRPSGPLGHLASAARQSAGEGGAGRPCG